MGGDVNGDVGDDDADDVDIDKEESCGGSGLHKPTAVKSWQVPPLSGPPACHHLFVFIQFHNCISSISDLYFLWLFRIFVSPSCQHVFKL